MSQNNDEEKQKRSPYSNPLARSSLFGQSAPPPPLPAIPDSQTASNPPYEEARIPEKQIVENQDNRQSGRQERWNASNPYSRQSTKPDSQQPDKVEEQIVEKPDKSRYGKAGYRLSPQSADQLEEMKLLLRRQLGRKVYYEEMIEEMIDQAYHEVKEKGQRSILTRRLSRKPEK